MTDYAALIKRLESGSGADMELSGLLDNFVMWGPHSEWENHGGGYERHKTTGEQRKFGLWSRVTLDYTGSLDAALAFAEAVLPDMNGHGYDKTPNVIEAYVSRNSVPSGHWLSEGKHRDSVPRAILIATLRAMQEQGK